VNATPGAKRKRDSAQPQERAQPLIKGANMSTKPKKNPGTVSMLDRSQPLLHQKGKEIQAYDAVTRYVPIGLSIEIREDIIQQMNQVVADTITIRDLYKKCHWQVAGPTFYQLHLLFDKHYNEQSELVDKLAERVQILGGVSIAMAHDVAETTVIPRAPRGREEVPVQISRLLEAHELIIKEAREGARHTQELGDDGSNDLYISDVLRTNEMQVWFLSEHVVSMPLVTAK
jgi:starvation-inducible DNA-binding protein